MKAPSIDNPPVIQKHYAVPKDNLITPLEAKNFGQHSLAAILFALLVKVKMFSYLYEQMCILASIIYCEYLFVPFFIIYVHTKILFRVYLAFQLPFKVKQANLYIVLHCVRRLFNFLQNRMAKWLRHKARQT